MLLILSYALTTPTSPYSTTTCTINLMPAVCVRIYAWPSTHQSEHVALASPQLLPQKFFLLTSCLGIRTSSSIVPSPPSPDDASSSIASMSWTLQPSPP